MSRPDHFLPRMRELLEKHPAPYGLTQIQVCQLLNVSQAQVSRGFAKLKDAGAVYICRWQRGNKRGAPPSCAYALGNLPDVECDIRRLSDKERVRRYRARKRGLPEKDALSAFFFAIIQPSNSFTSTSP